MAARPQALSWFQCPIGLPARVCCETTQTAGLHYYQTKTTDLNQAVITPGFESVRYNGVRNLDQVDS